jgi:hypothetical protein
MTKSTRSRSMWGTSSGTVPLEMPHAPQAGRVSLLPGEPLTGELVLLQVHAVLLLELRRNTLLKGRQGSDFNCRLLATLHKYRLQFQVLA